jgi:hypothetical protein
MAPETTATLPDVLRGWSPRDPALGFLRGGEERRGRRFVREHEEVACLPALVRRVNC